MREFIDLIRELQEHHKFIISLESAADLLELSNEATISKITVFSENELNIDILDCHIVDDIDKVPVCFQHGIKVTSVSRTIIDLISYKCDEQVIMESLAQYYYDHNYSYAGLDVPQNISIEFEQYKEWGQEYYVS